jgi:NADP-dependent 3-hydroxy acid dehydrogenase YdfG
MAAEPLTGRTALVTGASRGIGRECARLLLESGVEVVMLSRDMKAMQELADRKRRCAAFAADLSNPDALRPVLQQVRERLDGAPDIIVNNAGSFTIAPIEETEVDDLKGALRVNLAAPFLILKEFLGELKKENRGHVVTIGSVADHVAYPGNALYAATKYGARGMHEVLREETRGTGVRATLISPGPTDTAIWDAVDPDNQPGFTPRAKMLRPADVADAVLWAVTQPLNVNVDELRLSRS